MNERDDRQHDERPDAVVASAADAADAAREHGGAADAATPVETTERVDVQVRRSPRYGVFMALGAAVGAFVVWLLTALVPQDPSDGVDTSPVLGFMLLVGFVVGGALGALVAIILDATVGRRTRAAEAERTTITTPDAP